MSCFQFPTVMVGFSGNRERTALLDGDPFGEKVTYQEVIDGIGGTSINVGMQLAQLGIPVQVLLSVGKDLDAEQLRAELLARDLPFHLLPCRKATSFGNVEIGKNGQRRIGSYKAPYDHFPTEQVQQLVASYAPTAVLATGCTAEEEPLIGALFSAPGVKRILNPRETLCENRSVIGRLLANTDLLCVNAGEYQALRRKQFVRADIQGLHSLGPNIIIVTQGINGVTISERNGEIVTVSAKTFGLEKDATGAGDAFIAAFLSLYLMGHPIRDAAKFAVVVAGLKVQRLGGSNVVPLAEIEQHWHGPVELGKHMKLQPA